MAATAQAMQLGDVIRFGNGKAIKPGGEGCYPVYGSNGIIGGCDEFRYENGGEWVLTAVRWLSHAPRLHRRPARRTAFHRVVGGAWLGHWSASVRLPTCAPDGRMTS